MLSSLIFKIIKYVLFLVLIGMVFCFSFSCTPSKRLKRLIRLHPELLQSDTLYSVETFTLPGQSHDTIIYLDTNTNALSGIVDFYKDKLDSVSRSKLISKLHSYIIERPVLLDTFRIQLDDGGFIKVFQDGGKLKHVLFEPVKTTTVSIKTAVTNLYKDIPWRLPWYYVVIAFVCGIAIILFINFRQGRSVKSKP